VNSNSRWQWQNW